VCQCSCGLAARFDVKLDKITRVEALENNSSALNLSRQAPDSMAEPSSNTLRTQKAETVSD